MGVGGSGYGHTNNITGSLTRMLSLFFRTDKMTFTVNSNYPLAQVKTGTYHRFSDAAQDVVDVRIYQGIHFRFADTATIVDDTKIQPYAVNLDVNGQFLGRINFAPSYTSCQ
jgi:hypothetical protein